MRVFDSLSRQLGHAWRFPRRNPVFTVVAVASLALGIGANVTVFSWARAVLLDQAPGAQEPGRLVKFLQTDRDEEFVSHSYPDYRLYRDRATTLTLAVMRPVAATLGADSRNDRVWGQLVSGNYFEMVGLRPETGRLLTPDDDRKPKGHPVVVISDRLWNRRFGGDPAIVGRTVLLNTQPYTVIGVTPPGFRGLDTTLAFDVWMPVMMQEHFEPGGDRLEQPGHRWLDAYGRLKPGMTVAQAQAELETIRAQIDAERKREGLARSAALFPLWRAPRTGASILGPFVLVLGCVVGVVLLMACVNLAGVLLARSVSRRRELAIRVSLGASRADLVRELLTESLLLAVLGGAAGLLVARAGLGLLESWIPPTQFPVILGASLDRASLAYALLVSLLTGVVFGVAPALQASRANANVALRDESASVLSSRRGTQLRNGLVVAQLALSVVLLVVAGLFVRSLRNMQSLDLGFRPQGVLIGSFELFTSGYDAPRGRAFYREALGRLRALPGVSDASFCRRVPLGFGGSSSTSVTVDGYTPRKDETVWGRYNQVGPGFFRAMQMPLAAGRDVTDADDEGAQRVAVINEAMAKRYWPGRDALGGRFKVGDDWITVVGVARNAMLRDIGEPPSPWFFLPVLQSYRPDATVLLRTTGDPGSLARPLSDTLTAMDPNLALYGVTTLEKYIGASDFRQRVGSQILGLFGLLGLVLASIGLYGLLSFSVAQRTREIGIRVALGSDGPGIFRLVMRKGVVLVAVGLAVGGAVAAGAVVLLRSLLVGVGPWDPPTFLGVATVLAGVAALACALPAWRAMRLDPLVALRHE
jgi:predicted permease